MKTNNFRGDVTNKKRTEKATLDGTWHECAASMAAWNIARLASRSERRFEAGVSGAAERGNALSDGNSFCCAITMPRTSRCSLYSSSEEAKNRIATPEQMMLKSRVKISVFF